MNGGVEWRPQTGLDANAVAVGVGASLAASVLAAAVTAALVSFTALTETHLSVALYYAGLLIVVLGGAVGARRAARLGWVHGGIVGLASMGAAMLLIAILYPGTVAAGELARQEAMAFLAGCIGGVMGVNL